MSFIARVSLIIAFGLSSSVFAQNDAVFKLTVNKPINEVYKSVYQSLEEERFFVVLEPDIGKNISRFAKRWGDDYNRNQLTALRSMVFCNGWYANQVSNLDPDLLGFCPLHLTLIEKQGKTTALFNRPTVISQQSPAHTLFLEIEEKITNAIKKGMY